MTDFFAGTHTAALVLTALAGLAGGLAAGAWHFGSLAWNSRLFVEGRAGPAIALQSLRVAATAACLFALARVGPAALAAAGAGFLLARSAALRLAAQAAWTASTPRRPR